MCGIVGICESDRDRSVDETLLRKATDRLEHRGPDGSGLLCKQNIGLGHRRLSIIDLAGGDQPIYNEDGTVGVVFNGEIYNYLELKAMLEKAGHRFKTSSDTEVIVHAYEEYGERCVDHFIGMFGFAIWDGRDNSVFIARDRLGIKPLFYHHNRQRLIFASELKALLEDERTPRNINASALSEYLKWKYVPDDCSILNGVQKLLPGHWLRWKDGSITIKQYWDSTLATSDQNLSLEQWHELVEEKIRAAIRLRLRADVPLGVFLSGGVDSSGVVALASQELGKQLTTFSVGFGDYENDELLFARQVAKQYDTNHNEFIVSDQSIDILSSLAYHLDEPFADPSALPTYYVCREASKHVKVCLSGDGGDELFAGYKRYTDALKAHNRYDVVPGKLRNLLAGAILPFIPQTMWGRGELQRFGCLSTAQRYEAMMSSFTEQERRALLLDKGAIAGNRFEHYFNQAANPELISKLLYSDQKNYLPYDILTKVDRMSMQNSLEVRVPLLDHNVVEAVNSAPANLKLHHGEGKFLLRKILGPHLPEEIMTRKKMGFGIPMKEWFRDSLKDYAYDYLVSANSRSHDYLDKQAIRKTIDSHGVGMRDFSEKIWVLLMFEHWLRAYHI